MDSPLSDDQIRREWGQLQRLSRGDTGVVYLGHQTGQLALHLDPPKNGIHRVYLTVCSAPGIGGSPMVFYHAVVHRRTDDGTRIQQRQHFRHPFPALDWIHETVPDFDLLETVSVNLPDEDSASGPTSPATES